MILGCLGLRIIISSGILARLSFCTAERLEVRIPCGSASEKGERRMKRSLISFEPASRLHFLIIDYRLSLVFTRNALQAFTTYVILWRTVSKRASFFFLNQRASCIPRLIYTMMRIPPTERAVSSVAQHRTESCTR